MADWTGEWRERKERNELTIEWLSGKLTPTKPGNTHLDCNRWATLAANGSV